HEALGERVVDDDVPIVPGFTNVYVDPWPVRRVPEIVVDEPEDRIADHIIVTVEDLFGYDDELHVQSRRHHLWRGKHGLLRGAAVTFGERGANPMHVGILPQRRERRNHTTRTATRNERSIFAKPIFDWAAVTREDEASPFQNTM